MTPTLSKEVLVYLGDHILNPEFSTDYIIFHSFLSQ